MTDAPLVVEATGTATASVIWLHGLGADGHDFEPVVPELGRGLTEFTRFVFPHAPQQPVTINDGMVMRAWYDILEANLGREVDAAGVRASEGRLLELIAAEQAKGVPCERIVLAGFSQGGAIALETLLAYPHRLAGVLALSTYLPVPEQAPTRLANPHLDTPIFMAHGSQDPVIPLGLSESSRALLTELGFAVECHTYPMPHSVCAEELRDIADWLARILTQSAGRPALA